MSAQEDVFRFAKRRAELSVFLDNFKRQKSVATGQALMNELHSINQEFPEAFSASTIAKVEQAIKEIHETNRSKTI